MVIAASALHRCRLLAPRPQIVKAAVDLLSPLLCSCFGRRGLHFAAVVVEVVDVTVAVAGVRCFGSAGADEVAAAGETQVVVAHRRLLLAVAADVVVARLAARRLQGSHP